MFIKFGSVEFFLKNEKELNKDIINLENNFVISDISIFFFLNLLKLNIVFLFVIFGWIIININLVFVRLVIIFIFLNFLFFIIFIGNKNVINNFKSLNVYWFIGFKLGKKFM